MRAGRGLVAAALLWCAPTWAQVPDRWDRARDVEAERLTELADDVASRFDEATLRRNPLVQKNTAEELRAELEKAQARSSREPSLRFLLGRVLHMLGDDGQSIRVIREALEVAPTHRMAQQAMFDLAVSLARSDRSREEIDIWTDVLERDAEPGRRFNVLSNRAEAKAKLGDLQGALLDYDEVVRIAPQQPYPYFGYAVALDWSGDLSRAVQVAAQGVEIERQRRTLSLEGPGIFFVPAYTRWYFMAVRQAGVAQLAELPEDKASAWEAAGRYFELYVAAAPSFDRWARLAKARAKMAAAQAKRLHDEARKASRSAPQKRP